MVDVLFPGVNRMTCMPNIHFTFAVDSKNSRSLQSKIILNLAKKVGGLLGWKSNTLDSVLDSILLSHLQIVCANGKSATVQIWGFVELA